MVTWLICLPEELRTDTMLTSKTRKFIRQILDWHLQETATCLPPARQRRRWLTSSRTSNHRCSQWVCHKSHRMIWIDNNGRSKWWPSSIIPWQIKWLWCHPLVRCLQLVLAMAWTVLVEVWMVFHKWTLCSSRLMLCKSKSCNYVKWHKCKHKLPSFKTMRKHTTKAIPSLHHLNTRLRWWLQLLQLKIILRKPRKRIKTFKTSIGTHLLDPARNLCKILPKIDRANKCHQSKTIRATIKAKQRINGQIRYSIKVFKSKLKAIRNMKWCQKFQLKSLDRARLRKRKSCRRKKLLIRKVPPKMREII